MDIPIPDIQVINTKFPQYKQIEYFAKGGFKIVYKAQMKDSVNEALKLAYIPHPNNGTDEEKKEIADEMIKRIIREINLLAKCSSLHVVKLGNVKPTAVEFNSNNFIAYSEEFLNGLNLSALTKSKYKPNEEELHDLARSLLIAVKEFWFDHQFVHRDIKPLNVIKTELPDRKFVLLDLGIAFRIQDSSITRDPSYIPGSLNYLSPEMLQPNFRETLDYRSDLYMIGLTIYEYASGLQPFARRSDATGQTLYRILREKPRPLQEFRPDLSLSFCELINQFLKKLPALRPSNLLRLISFMEKSR